MCVTAVSHVLNEQTVRKIFEFVTHATAKIDHISWILSMKIVFACFFFANDKRNLIFRMSYIIA